jgi:hypothetical protein
MRVNPVFLMVLVGVSCQQALADDPPAPPAQAAVPAQSVAPTSVQPPATAPAGEKVAALATDQKTAPGTATSMVNPPVTVVGTKPDLTPAEKELLSRGYKVEMRHGEKYFCRKEQQIGSRFEVKNCDTAQSIEAHRADSQEAVRSIQNNRPQINN